MRYVVLVTNNDGGLPATLHDSLDAAKQAVRDALFVDVEPPITAEETAQVERDLAGLIGEFVESVRAPGGWKEWVYIAPIKES